MSTADRSASVADLSTEDVYHAIARDPDVAPGIYLDQVTVTAAGLDVTLCDELDRTAVYTLTVTRTDDHATPAQPTRGEDHNEGTRLLTERYGDLAHLLQEATTC